MRNIIPLLGWSLLALCCARPLPVEPPLAVSPLTLEATEWRVVDQVVVVTDASGTMYARRTFPLAAALTRSFVAGMPGAQVRAARPGPLEAGLVSFGGEERLAAPVAPFDRGALAATAASLRVLGDVDGMGGRTPFRDVFGELGQALDGRRERAAVVVFSDGLPDFPDRALAEAEGLTERYDGTVCFHTVQTGDDPLGTAFLTQLAALTPCGGHRRAASVRDPAAFMELVRDVFAGPAGAGGPGGDRCGDVVRLRGIEFEFDRARIRSESTVVLDVAMERLRACPNLRVRIDGHTCSVGTDDYNLALSQRRSESVRRHFVDAGIDPSRLESRGLGASDPIADNRSRDGRARNRRVELHPRP